LSIILPGIVRKGQDGSIGCDVGSLRAVNVAGLLLLAYLVLLCRQQIEARPHDRVPPGQAPIRSQYAAHTALNIALFPLLFFFSGLYYTDVLSTVAVVAAFLNHLSRLGHETTDLASDLTTILLGLASLLMRQTNVFWTVVFLGGLEAVHTVKSLKPQPTERPVLKSPWEQLKFSAWRYSLGEVHDPPLNMVWPDGKTSRSRSSRITG
jgi:alpha-1,2-glucosyltransferase